MNLKMRSIMKRIVAWIIVISMLWSESAITSFAASGNDVQTQMSEMLVEESKATTADQSTEDQNVVTDQTTNQSADAGLSVVTDQITNPIVDDDQNVEQGQTAKQSDDTEISADTKIVEVTPEEDVTSSLNTPGDSVSRGSDNAADDWFNIKLLNMGNIFTIQDEDGTKIYKVNDEGYYEEDGEKFTFSWYVDNELYASGVDTLDLSNNTNLDPSKVMMIMNRITDTGNMKVGECYGMEELMPLFRVYNASSNYLEEPIVQISDDGDTWELLENDVLSTTMKHLIRFQFENELPAGYRVAKRECLLNGKSVSWINADGQAEIPQDTYGNLEWCLTVENEETHESKEYKHLIKLIQIKNNITDVINVENIGSQLYGTFSAQIVQNSNLKDVYRGVEIANTKNNYSIKMLSNPAYNAKNGTITFKYMVDLSSMNIVDSSLDLSDYQKVTETIAKWKKEWKETPPGFILKTSAGDELIKIEVECDKKLYEIVNGVLLQHSLREDGHTAEFEKAVVVDPSVYNGELILSSAAEGKSVVSIKSGALSEIYQNGQRINSPVKVRLPYDLLEIDRLIHNNYKDQARLKKIAIDRGYQYLVNATGDDPYGSALFERKSQTEYTLKEIASDYYGILLWPQKAGETEWSAEWTDEAAKLDFSKITGFALEKESEDYCVENGMLIDARENELLMVPGSNHAATLVIPEGIKKVKGYALANVTANTIVFPSSIESWGNAENKAVTNAKFIYSYGKVDAENDINLAENLDDSVKGITFFGNVKKDAANKDTSALMNWVSANKAKGHKFVALAKTKEDSSDLVIYNKSYVAKTKELNGKTIEYYEIPLGSVLDENYDFVIQKENNPYYKDSTITIDDYKYGTPDEIDSRYIREFETIAKGKMANRLGVKRLDFVKDKEVIKTVYLVIKADDFTFFIKNHLFVLLDDATSIRDNSRDFCAEGINNYRSTVGSNSIDELTAFGEEFKLSMPSITEETSLWKIEQNGGEITVIPEIKADTSYRKEELVFHVFGKEYPLVIYPIFKMSNGKNSTSWEVHMGLEGDIWDINKTTEVALYTDAAHTQKLKYSDATVTYAGKTINLFEFDSNDSIIQLAKDSSGNAVLKLKDPSVSITAPTEENVYAVGGISFGPHDKNGMPLDQKTINLIDSRTISKDFKVTQIPIEMNGTVKGSGFARSGALTFMLDGKIIKPGISDITLSPNTEYELIVNENGQIFLKNKFDCTSVSCNGVKDYMKKISKQPVILTYKEMSTEFIPSLVYTNPELEWMEGTKLTVNMDILEKYDGDTYRYEIPYTITDGFEIEFAIEPKDKNAIKYKDSFNVDNNTPGKTYLQIASDTPAGTYQFKTNVAVTAKGDTKSAKENVLNTQIAIVVNRPKLVATVDHNVLNINKNYTATKASTLIHFDASKYQFGENTYLYTMKDASVVFTKTPALKTQAEKNAKNNLIVVQDNQIIANPSADLVAGDYQVQIIPTVNASTKGSLSRDLVCEPIKVTIKVAKTAPTISLQQTKVTMDRGTTSNSCNIDWLVTGDYLSVEPTYEVVTGKALDKEAFKAMAPQLSFSSTSGNIVVTLMDGYGASSVNGTYNYKITPKIKLDKSTELVYKPVNLQVTVTSNIYKVIASKSKVTGYNNYTPDCGADKELAGVRFKSESGGLIMADPNLLLPADKATKDKLDKMGNSGAAFKKCITVSQDSKNQYTDWVFEPFKEKLPTGTYNMLVYCQAQYHYYEPVKISFVVANKNFAKTLTRSTNTATLKTGFSGECSIGLKDENGAIKEATSKTEYVVYCNKKYMVTDTLPDMYYAKLETSPDGTLVVSAGNEAKNLKKKTTIKLSKYTQELKLKNGEAFTLMADLNIVFDPSIPTARVSAPKSTVTLNTNYDLDSGIQKKVCCMDVVEGDKIVDYKIITPTTATQAGVQLLATKNQSTGSLDFDVKASSNSKAGTYKFKVTPYVEDGDDNKVALKALELKVVLNKTLATVTADKKAIVLMHGDYREATYQTVKLSTNMKNAAIHLEGISLASAPKGVDKNAEGLILRSYNEREVVIGLSDCDVPAGKYVLDVKTSTTNEINPKIQSNKITVTVKTPKLTVTPTSSKITVNAMDVTKYYAYFSLLFKGDMADRIEEIRWDVIQKSLPKDATADMITLNLVNGGRGVGVHCDTEAVPGKYVYSLVPKSLRAGVDIPLPKAVTFTVNVVKTEPVVKLSANKITNLNGNFAQTQKIKVTSSMPDWDINQMDFALASYPKTADTNKLGIALQYDDVTDTISVTTARNVKNGTYTYNIAPSAMKKVIYNKFDTGEFHLTLATQKLTVVVNNSIPTATASTKKVTLNKQYADKYQAEYKKLNAGESSDGLNNTISWKLSGNYDDFEFKPELFKIAFAGKAAQLDEADRIGFHVAADGTISANLKSNAIAKGTYKFNITPVIDSKSGTRMQLKPVAIDIAVVDTIQKATAKASGSIKVSKPTAGITYTVTLADKLTDEIEEVTISDELAQYFTCQQVSVKDSSKIIVKRNQFANERVQPGAKYSGTLIVKTKLGKTITTNVTISVGK